MSGKWVTATVRFDSTVRRYDYAYDGDVAVGDKARVNVNGTIKTVEVTAVRDGVSSKATKVLVEVIKVDRSALERQARFDAIKAKRSELERRISEARKKVEIRQLIEVDSQIAVLQEELAEVELKDATEKVGEVHVELFAKASYSDDVRYGWGNQ